MGDKYLVYLVAFGDFYKELCKLTVQSIRHFGFKGDVLVFTEKDFDFGADVIVDNVFDGRQELIRTDSGKLFRNRSEQVKYDYVKARGCVNLWRDLSSYKHVLYCDCDVLASGDITTIFQSAPEDALTCLMQSHRTLAQGCGEYLLPFLPVANQNLAKEGLKSNAGIMLMPIKIIDEFLKQWRILYELLIPLNIEIQDFNQISKRNIMHDEYLLNFMIARGDVKRVFDERIGFRKKHGNKLLYHFIGNPEKSFKEMKVFYEQFIKDK